MTSTLQANHFFENNSFGASPFFGRPLSSRIYPTENSISGPVFGNNIWQSGSRADYGSTRNHVSGQARARQPNLSLVLPSIISNAQTFGLPGEKRSPITADVAGALQTEPSSAHSRSQNESAILTPTSLTSHSETSSQVGQHRPDAKPQLNSGFTGSIFAGRGNPWPSVREFQPSFASTQPRATNGGITDFPKKASAPLNAPQATEETAHHSLDSIWAENNKPRKLDRVYQLNDPKSAIARSAFLNGNDCKKNLANARLDNSVSTHQLASLVHSVRLDSQGGERQDYRHGPFKHNQGRPYNLAQSGNQGFREAEQQYQSDLRAQNAYGQRHNPALRNNDYSHEGTDRTPYSTSAPLSNLYPNRCEHRDIVSYDAALISQPDSSSGRLPNFVDDYGSHDLQSYASQVYGNTLCGPASNGAADARHAFCAYDTALGPPYLFSDLPVDRQNEAHQIVRSPLLEEFRLNGKTKKYELRDIYDHIVEFSGDQLGSRFIQHKLEIANSDEKDRVFKEIASNSRQLMTDVFGNYVIQKMFEHGNQSQKRVLANHMKGHVYALSTQTYGCRVVQKALEHILTDQQASLIQELEGRVLAVVENQNGNHVIQKAVEQVPGEHIQFIVDAHIGHVHYLAKHPYGCRVIQRMLEHCEPRAKRQILDELHLDIGDLIQDPFGNYVVQHVIVKGEMQDRKPVIDKVQTRLMENAMHKFASNVVEKALDYAEEDQRHAMLRKLTARDEHGQSQIIKLLSHQYGNYVIQKCAAHLSGHALHSVVEEMEQYLMQLRRVSTGKQVLALEGSIRDARQRLISQHYENPLQRAPTQPRTAVARR